MTGLYKDKLQFDPSFLSDSDNIGAFLRDGYGNLVTSTLTGGKRALDVNVVNTDTVNSGIFAEDTAHSSGAKGQFILAVQQSADVALADEGDYAPLQVDENGNLKVVADLDVSFDYVYAEDAAHTSADLGAYVLAVRSDNMPAGASAGNGDYTSFFVDGYGAQWVDAVGSRFDGEADNNTDGRDRAVKVGTRTVDAPLAASSAGVRADMISDIFRRVYVNDSPNVGLACVSKTVTDTASALVASALSSRRRILIQNVDTQAIYVGPSGVATTSGLRVAGGATLVLEAGPALDFHAVTASGNTADVRVFELG